MSASNCSPFGETQEKLYGYAARLMDKNLDVVLCIPIIDDPVEFNVEAHNAKGTAQTRLGDELRRATQEVVIYTNKSEMSRSLRDPLEDVCTLVDHPEIEFQMCVATNDVMLPNAEYNGTTVQPIDQPYVNLCNHNYETPIAFLQAVLDYPPPEP
ncbi:hypothetical protein [Haloarchaeobius baliensis]|uniref:hypothetical protein n=1 Tax=Haloarchaeobius baliensis TaxID=1670458 RepID=UPI003F8858F4